MITAVKAVWIVDEGDGCFSLTDADGEGADVGWLGIDGDEHFLARSEKELRDVCEVHGVEVLGVTVLTDD